jgi:hypothetical protein
LWRINYDLIMLPFEGILRPNPGGGRSASYDLVWDDIPGYGFNSAI